MLHSELLALRVAAAAVEQSGVELLGEERVLEALELGRVDGGLKQKATVFAATLVCGLAASADVFANSAASFSTSSLLLGMNTAPAMCPSSHSFCSRTSTSTALPSLRFCFTVPSVSFVCVGSSALARLNHTMLRIPAIANAF